MKTGLRIYILFILIIAAAFQSRAQLPISLDPSLQVGNIAMFNAVKHELPTHILPQLIDDEQPAFIADMLDYARSFTGLRYRRGGKTPKGFDCSGFTGHVFDQFGIRLKASSREQYVEGNEVNREDLRPGDLVFFTGHSVRGKRVGHVGIVTTVDPDGHHFRFIHSACSSGITESHSSEPYYKVRYIGAKRMY